MLRVQKFKLLMSVWELNCVTTCAEHNSYNRFILSWSIQAGISEAFKTQWNNENRISVVSLGKITIQDVQYLVFNSCYVLTKNTNVHLQMTFSVMSYDLDPESAKTTLERNRLPHGKTHYRPTCCCSDLFRTLVISLSQMADSGRVVSLAFVCKIHSEFQMKRQSCLPNYVQSKTNQATGTTVLTGASRRLYGYIA
jgi:hypothetical protein